MIQAKVPEQSDTNIEPTSAGLKRRDLLGAVEYPPMQKGASFNLEAVKAQVEKAIAAHAK